MSLCINPSCTKPFDPLNAANTICRHCGSQLVLQNSYRVQHLLSDASGFGTIYEVDAQGTPKILKVLKGQINSQSKAVELFQKEAEVLSKLRHPGIPKVEADGYFTFLPRGSQELLHCLVMEKIEGLNLEEWSSNRHHPPMPQDLALDWLKQIVQILDKVHQQDYFHRDIKPSNIMLRPSGHLALIDFGTAREVTGTYLAKVGGIGKITKITSAGYTPPEQEKGHAVPQSDFYALGRTFVYLLTGKEPTDLDIYDPYNDELRWHKYAPQISSLLINFIDYLMAPKAGNRPHNTQVILQEIAEIERTFDNFQLLQTPKPTLAKLSTVLPPTPKSRRLVGDAVLLLGLTVIALGGALQALQQSRLPEPVSANIFPSPQIHRLPEPVSASIFPSPQIHRLPEPVSANIFSSSQTPLSLDPVSTSISPSSPPQSWKNSEIKHFHKQFPFKSQAQGVTLTVNSATQQGSSFLLNVTLKNEGMQAVKFLYGFLNVTDEQGYTLAACIKGLPAELPANREEFSGTVSIPIALMENAKKLSLTLPDYPEQKLHLQISGIPVERFER